jgi:lycopene beta-cyclase
LNNNQQLYDYIFAGTGAAAMSLLVHMKEAGLLENKKILLTDYDSKNTNDRTWCFWEKGPGIFDPILYHHWRRLAVFGKDLAKEEFIAPYTYKMIRGIDFYNYCLAQLSNVKGITLVKGTVTAIDSSPAGASLTINGQTYSAPFIFSSILLQPPQLKKHQHYLLQHFKGWMIETPQDEFDPARATFMDFRVGQQHGTTFAYMLPFTQRRALVEYTLFTKDELTDAQYDEGLKNYIQDFLKITEYSIAETEKGVIPMTDYRFAATEGNIIYLGTAGGNTRGSSGYTFRNLQQHAAQLTALIKSGQSPLKAKPVIGSRAKFYDAVMLGVLGNNYAPGHEVFSQLLRKRKLPEVLRFLDGEPGWWNELKVILSEPKIPFMKAALQKLMHRNHR